MIDSDRMDQLLFSRPETTPWQFSPGMDPYPSGQWNEPVTPRAQGTPDVELRGDLRTSGGSDQKRFVGDKKLFRRSLRIGCLKPAGSIRLEHLMQVREVHKRKYGRSDVFCFVLSFCGIRMEGMAV